MHACMRQALLGKGVALEQAMLRVDGHRLKAPVLLGDRGIEVVLNSYAHNFRAAAPPTYRLHRFQLSCETPEPPWLPWRLWCFTGEWKEMQQVDLNYNPYGWSGVGVEVFWLLAPSPYRAGQVGVRWLQATVCRGCHTDAREERGPIRSRRCLG